MPKTSFIRPGLSALVGLAAFLIAGAVSAADPVRYTAQKKLRLHVDTDFFGWTQGRPWYEPNERPDPDPNARINIIGFGTLRPLLNDRTSSGSFDYGSGSVYTGGSMFAFGLGYGVHRHVIVGARLGFAFDRLRSRSDMDIDDDSFTAVRFFSGVFTPYIEVLPIPEGRILPYFLFRTGFAGAVIGAHTQGDPNIDTLMRQSAIAPIVGAGAGAHFFLIPQFSLDLGLNFDYRWTLTRNTTKDLATDDSLKDDWKRSTRAFNLGVNLGLSVWFL